MSNPHEGHRERLKRRFLLEGLDHFEPHNALELLLFYAVGRCDTNGLAHELLDRFGSIAGVMDAPISELMKVKGVGKIRPFFSSWFLPFCGNISRIRLRLPLFSTPLK